MPKTTPPDKMHKFLFKKPATPPKKYVLPRLEDEPSFFDMGAVMLCALDRDDWDSKFMWAAKESEFYRGAPRYMYLDMDNTARSHLRRFTLFEKAPCNTDVLS